jgi:hypothetical protein
MELERVSRLVTAFDHSRRKLLPFRERRLSMIRQFVGGAWSDGGAPDKVPVNFLEMALNIYRRQVAAKAPRIMVRSRGGDNIPFADDIELAVNLSLEDMKFDDTMRRWVLEAMFGMGVLKVGLAPSDRKEILGFTHDPGQPFADVVDFEDFVFDITARRWDQVQFCGNRYALPIDAVKDLKMFPGGKLVKYERRTSNEQGDEKVSNMVDDGGSYGEESYMDLVELWDVWLPYESVVATFQASPDGGIDSREPLRKVDWEGPECGPYHLLSFGDVPGQIMPLPPASLMIDLHELGNRVFRKLGRQADRQKTVTLVASGNQEDGRRVTSANDGDAISVDRPEATKEIRYGGVDQATLAFFQQLRQLTSYFGGNLETLGGLNNATNTASQEQLVKDQASMRIADMQERATSAATDVIKAIAYYMWSDPVREYRVRKQIPGTDMSISTTIKPERRDGEFLDYAIEIVPFSMQSRTPAERLQTAMQVMQTFVVPLAPVLQQRGLVPDIEAFLKMSAELSGAPEVLELVTKVEPQEMQQGPPPQGGGRGQAPRPASTTRNYVRSDRGADSISQQDQAIAQMMQAASAQGG